MGVPRPGSVWRLREATLKEVTEFIAEVVRRLRDKRAIAPAEVPTEKDIAELVDAALWASTIADEARYPKFKVVFCPPGEGSVRIHELPVTASNLASLAPVAAHALSRIGVHRSSQGGLRIWGLQAGRTSYFEIQVIAPGQMTLRFRPHNIAVIRGNEYLSLLRRDPEHGVHGLGLEYFAKVVFEALSTNLPPEERAVTSVVLVMAVEAILNQGHGGTMLVLPAKGADRINAEKWIDFGTRRITHPVGLGDLVRDYASRIKGTPDPFVALLELEGVKEYVAQDSGVDAGLIEPASIIGQLSSVDGAIVLTTELEILGFGAMTRAPDGSAGPTRSDVFRRSLLDYGDDKRPGELVPIHHLGGARRRSAASFLVNNYDTLVVTVSHDGPVSLGMWAARTASNEAAAHLVLDMETLLMK